MSQRNVELVKSLQPNAVDLVELFAQDERGGAPNMLAWASADLFVADFEVRFVSGVQGVELEYRGLEGFIRGWRDWLAAWASYWVYVDDFIDADDQVVALLRVRARTSRDGVVMEHSPAAVWTIEGGRVAGIHMYLAREEALRAVDRSRTTSPRNPIGSEFEHDSLGGT